MPTSQMTTNREKMYTKVLKVQAEYPDHVTFFAGDMNDCLSSKDSINRTGSQSKIHLSDVIRYNNRVAELSDAYMSNHDDGGYTWKRGNIYSRLD